MKNKKSFRPEFLMALLLVLMATFYLTQPDVEKAKNLSYLQGQKDAAETLITECIFVSDKDENWMDLVNDVLGGIEPGTYKNIVFSRGDTMPVEWFAGYITEGEITFGDDCIVKDDAIMPLNGGPVLLVPANFIGEGEYIGPKLFNRSDGGTLN